MLDLHMSIAPNGAGPTTYEVLVRGELSDDLIADLGARRFEPLAGKTVILVDVIDQSHLHSVLGWLQDRNIVIERVNPVWAARSGADTNPMTWATRFKAREYVRGSLWVIPLAGAVLGAILGSGLLETERAVDVPSYWQ